MRTESGLEGHRGESCKSFGMMVARDGVEPPTPAFSATLCCVLNNLSDFRWPPKYLRSRERHANRGLKSWVQKQAQKAPQPRHARARNSQCRCNASAYAFRRAGYYCHFLRQSAHNLPPFLVRLTIHPNANSWESGLDLRRCLSKRLTNDRRNSCLIRIIGG